MLESIRPPIWRRLELPADLLLPDLHEVLQVAFGWLSYHLHQFESAGLAWAPPGDDEDGGTLDERGARFGTILRAKGDVLRYWYDFGDDWYHRLVVEAVVAPEPGVAYPRCTAGRRSGPPEDCGGPYGYADLLAALADPTHPEHDELREWLGASFDPEHFDREAVNGTLAKMARAITSRR